MIRQNQFIKFQENILKQEHLKQRVLELWQELVRNGTSVKVLRRETEFWNEAELLDQNLQ